MRLLHYISRSDLPFATSKMLLRLHYIVFGFEYLQQIYAASLNAADDDGAHCACIVDERLHATVFRECKPFAQSIMKNKQIFLFYKLALNHTFVACHFEPNQLLNH